MLLTCSPSVMTFARTVEMIYPWAKFAYLVIPMGACRMQYIATVFHILCISSIFLVLLLYVVLLRLLPSSSQVMQVNMGTRISWLGGTHYCIQTDMHILQHSEVYLCNLLLRNASCSSHEYQRRSILDSLCNGAKAWLEKHFTQHIHHNKDVRRHDMHNIHMTCPLHRILQPSLLLLVWQWISLRPCNWPRDVCHTSKKKASIGEGKAEERKS